MHQPWLPAMLACLTLVLAKDARAHWDNGYLNDGTLDQSKHSWMRTVPDGARISELSLPGTHDTLAFYGGDSVQTQSQPLTVQLNAGIRVLDIRARHIQNVFAIHHGLVFQNAYFGDGVMKPVTAFLRAHPSETVLIRLREEYDPDGNSRSFADTFFWYMSLYDGDVQATYGDYVWRPNGASNPTMSQIRGKVVFMLQPSLFNDSQMAAWGIPYGNSGIMSIKDDFNLKSNGYLYDKWESIKTQLRAAESGDRNLIYINFLSGSGGSFPYFVASGHSSSGTGASRLSTGLTTPGWEDSYPDFPRVDCFLGICTIAFEGTNTLTKDQLLAGRAKFSGIVIADFPGDGLINAIIERNPAKSFAVRSQLNNKCLSLDVATANVQMWDCFGGSGQRWIYDNATGTIRSPASDNCLDAAGPYGNAYMGSCHYGANQQWDLLPSGEIRDRAYGQCLDVAGFNDSNGANVQMWDCSNASNQKWTRSTFLAVTLASAFNGRCMDLDVATSNVQMWDCVGGSNQRWTYDNATGTIRSSASDRCLDASGPYGNAYMGSCHYGANQQWDLLPSGEIRDRAYGQCLDLAGFSNSNGANVQMWDCSHANNQRWYVNR